MKIVLSWIAGVLATAIAISLAAVIVASAWFSITDATKAIEILKVLLSWPIMGSAIAFTILIVFKESLSEWMRRWTKAKFGGVEFESPMSEQAKLPSGDKDPRKGEISWDEWAHQMKKKFSPKEAEIVQNLGEKQQELIDRIFHAWWFEKIWGRIYNTQLSFLEKLIAANTAGLHTKDMEPFFTVYRYKLRDINPIIRNRAVHETTFLIALKDSYVSFLQSAMLISIEGDIIKSTKLTKRFLEYLKTQGYDKAMRIL